MTLDAELITSLATLVTAIGALVYAIRGDNNSRRNTRIANENTASIQEIHNATNGMKNELVNEVRAAATLAGEKSGAAEEKREAKIRETQNQGR